MTDETVTAIAHALSDPIRLRILRQVARGRDDACCSPMDACCPQGVCVCDLEQALGMIQSKVSYHMRELLKAKLVRETRQGRWNYYMLDAGTLAAFAAAVGATAVPAGPVGTQKRPRQADGGRRPDADEVAPPAR